MLAVGEHWEVNTLPVGFGDVATFRTFWGVLGPEATCEGWKSGWTAMKEPASVTGKGDRGRDGQKGVEV